MNFARVRFSRIFDGGKRYPGPFDIAKQRECTCDLAINSAAIAGVPRSAHCHRRSGGQNELLAGRHCFEHDLTGDAEGQGRRPVLQNEECLGAASDNPELVSPFRHLPSCIPVSAAQNCMIVRQVPWLRTPNRCSYPAQTSMRSHLGNRQSKVCGIAQGCGNILLCSGSFRQTEQCSQIVDNRPILRGKHAADDEDITWSHLPRNSVNSQGRGYSARGARRCAEKRRGRLP